MIEPTTAPAASSAPSVRTAAFEKRRRQMLNPFLMRLYYLAKLPLAFVAGLRLREFDERRAVVTVPYGWRTTNPFRSTYFAALSMAAELSTGALAMASTDLAPRPVALLIVGLTASFEKKATGLTTFTCEEGDKLAAAVARTLETGEPATAEVETIGRAPDGTVVARLTFTWSFKVRAHKS